MRVNTTGAALALAIAHSVPSAAKESAPRPCTVKSDLTGSFFDLSPITVPRPDSGKKVPKGANDESWHANGFDYGSNFTLNFCAPVVEKLDEVVGVYKDDWEDVAAYYEDHGYTYSIG
jgi:cation-dependent mannose-6-phosphate receptor